MRARNIQSQKATYPRHANIDQVQARPLGRAKGGVNDQKDQKNGYRYNDQQPRLRPFLAFILACPFDAIKGWKLYPFIDSVHRFFNGSTQVSAAHTVSNGNVAR